MKTYNIFVIGEDKRTLIHRVQGDYLSPQKGVVLICKWNDNGTSKLIASIPNTLIIEENRDEK